MTKNMSSFNGNFKRGIHQQFTAIPHEMFGSPSSFAVKKHLFDYSDTINPVIPMVIGY